MNNIGEADLSLLKKLYPNNFENLLKKVKNHYPIQYLIGHVDFYNTKIKVNENVLIPRFETELLVKYAIDFLKDKKINNLIDICTGSGAIAIALKSNLNVAIDACDISNQALELANINSKDNKISINFFKIDILKEKPNKKYDCLISNPPYLKKGEITSLETKYEPQIALYANNNGLEFYERILDISQDILNYPGYIIFEIGATQAYDITNMTRHYYPNAKIKIKKDFNNFDRYIFIEL